MNLPSPMTVDHLDLQVVADGHHSVPTSVRVTACNTLPVSSHCVADASNSVEIKLPPIADGRRQGDTVTVPLNFRPLTGRFLTFTFTSVRTETSVNYYSRVPSRDAHRDRRARHPGSGRTGAAREHPGGVHRQAPHGRLQAGLGAGQRARALQRSTATSCPSRSAVPTPGTEARSGHTTQSSPPTGTRTERTRRAGTSTSSRSTRRPEELPSPTSRAIPSSRRPSTAGPRR